MSILGVTGPAGWLWWVKAESENVRLDNLPNKPYKELKMTRTTAKTNSKRNAFGPRQGWCVAGHLYPILDAGGLT